MNLPAPVEAAVNRAAEKYRLSPYALLMKTQVARVVEARREVFRELRDEGFSLSWIGRWFDKDHATVHHHLKDRKERAPRVRLPKGPPEGEHGGIDSQGRFCDRCGERDAGNNLEPEGYHFVCRNPVMCAVRQDRYHAMRRFLAKRFALRGGTA